MASTTSGEAPSSGRPAPIADAGLRVPQPRPATHRSEVQRLHDLHNLNILDTEPEQVFDDLVAIASRIAGVPTALVSLIDQDRQWFKAKAGFDACSTGRDVAFCDHVVRAGAELEVPDARLDRRFAGNPLVTGPPGIVFYAGFPLLTSTGSIPGTLCVIGYGPHRLDDEQKVLLRALARQVVTQLELRVDNIDQAHEIQLRKAVEAELARSRHEFQLLAENSRDVITRFEADMTVAYLSPSAETVLGLRPDDVVGQQPGPFLHPDAAGEFEQAFKEALRGGARTITVQALSRKDVRPWLEITFAPITSPSGFPGVLTTARDVTGRINATEDLARSEQRFRSVHQDSPVGIVLFNQLGQIIEVNPALCRFLARDEAEIIGRQHDAFVVPGDEEPVEIVAYRAGHDLGDTVQMERRIVRGDGEVRWAWITGVRVAGPDGEPWTLSHIQDITARKTAEQALADSEANLAAISSVVRRIQSGEDPRETIVTAARDIAQTDSATLVEASPDEPGSLTVTASRVRDGADGPPGQPLVGTSFSIDTPSITTQVWRTGEQVFVPDALADERVNASMHSMLGGRSFLWQPITSHGVVTALLSVSWNHVITSLSERAVRAVLLLADEAAVALEHDALMRQYEELATTDGLTGLPNRRAWDERMAVLLALAERTGEPMVVAFADVDHFKAFNDTHGHLEGDALLREIGIGIRAQLRAVDVVARWGGEEFAIALPNCSLADATVVLERVRAATPRGQTISLGLAQWTPGTGAAGLMDRADQALYEAKRSGRNRVVAAPLP